MPLLELQLIFHNRDLLPLPSFRDPPWMIATWAEPLLEQLKGFWRALRFALNLCRCQRMQVI